MNTEIEVLAEALLFNGRFGTESGPDAAKRRISERKAAAAALTAQAEQIARLEGALAVFAAIRPSTFYPEDGSAGEAYQFILSDGFGPPDFTGADMANARALLTPEAS